MVEKLHFDDLTQDTVPWEQIPKGLDWAARGASGRADVFEDEPHRLDAVWIGTRTSRIDHIHAGYQRGTCDWKDSLQRRPEGV